MIFLLCLLVDCRIGSLEMFDIQLAHLLAVDCCIGSLERERFGNDPAAYVDCRIGSLENYQREVL